MDSGACKSGILFRKGGSKYCFKKEQGLLTLTGRRDTTGPQHPACASSTPYRYVDVASATTLGALFRD